MCVCDHGDHVTHLRDYGLWVSLVHPQRYHGDIDGVAWAPRQTEQLIRNVARLAHDHRHTESWGLLGSHRHHQLGEQEQHPACDTHHTLEEMQKDGK